MEELKLPEHFEEYAEGRKAGFLKMKAAKEQGKKVAGYFCTFTPLEVLDAAGLLSVGLCGMSNETVSAAETVLPKNLCPLVKSSYGFALTDKCPYTYWSDVIIGETTCDAKKKMYELLGERKKMFVLHLPQGIEPAYVKAQWRSELRRFVAFIEKEFQVELTDEKLRAAAKKRNQLRSERLRLMEVQKLSPAPISGVKLYKFMEGLSFNFDLDNAIAAVKSLRAEILKEYELADKTPTKRRRILITGCPIGGVLDKVVGAIERSGADVVCFENCSGIKAMRCLVDTEREDIVDAIADAYLDIGCSVMTPNEKRMENIPKLIGEFRCDAVIDVTLQTCLTYAVETRSVRRLCEELSVPYMSLETDYSQEDGGQLDTRIAAFIEMLDA